MGLISRVSSRTYRKKSRLNPQKHSFKSTKMAQKALYRHPIDKKRNKKFRRHQSDRFMRVPESWRKPKGIDNSTRRRYSGTMKMPSIGFGTNAKTRHCCRDKLGFRKFLVHNIDELNCLMMSNRKFAAEIAKGVSARKRKGIIERAAALNVHVTNAKAKVRTEENE